MYDSGDPPAIVPSLSPATYYNSDGAPPPPPPSAPPPPLIHSSQQYYQPNHNNQQQGQAFYQPAEYYHGAPQPPPSLYPQYDGSSTNGSNNPFEAQYHPPPTQTSAVSSTGVLWGDVAVPSTSQQPSSPSARWRGAYNAVQFQRWIQPLGLQREDSSNAAAVGLSQNGVEPLGGNGYAPANETQQQPLYVPPSNGYQPTYQAYYNNNGACDGAVVNGCGFQQPPETLSPLGQTRAAARWGAATRAIQFNRFIYPPPPAPAPVTSGSELLGGLEPLGAAVQGSRHPSMANNSQEHHLHAPARQHPAPVHHHGSHSHHHAAAASPTQDNDLQSSPSLVSEGSWVLPSEEPDKRRRCVRPGCPCDAHDPLDRAFRFPGYCSPLCAAGHHCQHRAHIQPLLKHGFAWDSDSILHCSKCSDHFGFFNRKHHCRSCGHIFCGKCCSNKINLSGVEGGQEHLTCQDCALLIMQARTKNSQLHPNS